MANPIIAPGSSMTCSVQGSYTPGNAGWDGMHPTSADDTALSDSLNWVIDDDTPHDIADNENNPQSWNVSGNSSALTISVPSIGHIANSYCAYFRVGSNAWVYVVFDVGTSSGPQPTAHLTASSTSVCEGTAVTLTYTTTNATATSISGLGSVSINTTGTISTGALSLGSHTFTLTATGAAGTTPATSSVTITATDCSNTCVAVATYAFAPPAVNVQIALSADPATILQGGFSTVNVNTVNAISASLDNGIGDAGLVVNTYDMTGIASVLVNPDSTATYNGVALGAWLTRATAQTTLNVTPQAARDECGCEWTAKPDPVGTWKRTGC